MTYKPTPKDLFWKEKMQGLSQAQQEDAIGKMVVAGKEWQSGNCSIWGSASIQKVT